MLRLILVCVSVLPLAGYAGEHQGLLKRFKERVMEIAELEAKIRELQSEIVQRKYEIRNDKAQQLTGYANATQLDASYFKPHSQLKNGYTLTKDLPKALWSYNMFVGDTIILINGEPPPSERELAVVLNARHREIEIRIVRSIESVTLTITDYKQSDGP